MAYSDEILALTPAAYWKLDETSGSSLIDSSGNGRTLTAFGNFDVNQSPLTPSDSSGKSIIIRSGLLTHPTQYAQTEADGFDMVGQEFSISLWYRPIALSGTDTVIMYKFDQTTLRGWGVYHVGAANRIGYSIGDGIGAYGGSTTSMVAGNWYHIVMVVSNPSAPVITAYTNGTLETLAYLTRSPTPILLSARALNVGAWHASSPTVYPVTTAVNSIIDDIQIFKSALTSGQVTTLYNRGIANTESDDTTEFNKFAHWRMNDDNPYYFQDMVGGRHLYKIGLPKIVTGQVGSAAQFTNVIAGAVRSPVFSGFTNITVVMTVNIINSGMPQDSCLVSYASATSASEFMIQLLANTNRLRITIRSVNVDASFSLMTGINHIAVTWRNSDGRTQAWVNGSLVVTGTASSGITMGSNGGFNLSAAQGSVAASYFNPANAGFDDVAVYSSVLTDAQINRLWVTYQSTVSEAPTVLTAISITLNTVRVIFNTPVAGLLDTANFTIPSLTVTATAPGGNSTYVDLTTTGMTVGNSYTLTVGANVNNGTALIDNVIDFIGGTLDKNNDTETISGTMLRTLAGQPWADPAGEAAPANVVKYLMRGYKFGDNTYVYWLVEDEPDFLATQAPVAAILLNDIVVAQTLYPNFCE